ncbi:GntR family transcriptional regulator [Azospirillum sp. SYSU D00513]|uniref:GntR family transcriptional regulator n=1 Tax=Azospirillum sp. SYSU D00513 TaxID=2812561 RepID=UPI001A96B7CE|nr:GntR family transcriptional regulator [Azospirillum sp. SYSU D00513]
MSKDAALDLPSLERGARETVGQWVYRSLRAAVMIGRIPPGQPLTIRGIAEALGVSTMPVREALRRLSAEQALEIRDSRRVLVPHMTPARFRELCELRIALETHAAERALPYITPARIEELAAIDRGIDEAHAAGDQERATILNQEFHRAIYTANPHQISLSLVESVWLQLGPFVRLALSRLREHYKIDRHSEALAAMRRQDAFALRIAIEADIRDGIAHVGTSELLTAYVGSGGKRMATVG